MENITLTPIETEDEYITAMDNLRKFWGCSENSKEADLLGLLSIMIEDYEKKYYRIKLECTQ